MQAFKAFAVHAVSCVAKTSSARVSALKAHPGERSRSRLLFLYRPNRSLRRSRLMGRRCMKLQYLQQARSDITVGFLLKWRKASHMGLDVRLQAVDVKLSEPSV